MTTTDVRSTSLTHDAVDLRAIRRTAYGIARDVTDRIDPEELAQEAMIRYWMTFGTTGRPDHLYGWLRTVIRRLSMDHDRRDRGRHGQWRRPGVLDLTDRTICCHPELMTSSPSRKVIAADLWERALAPLSPRDRKVFEMRLDGIPARSVAQDLGLSCAAVDQIFRRAKLRLAAALRADAELKSDLRAMPYACSLTMAAPTRSAGDGLSSVDMSGLPVASGHEHPTPDSETPDRVLSDPATV